MKWFWATLVLAMALVSKALAIGECTCEGGVSTCPEGYCCSKGGYCGVSAEWCAPQNCQCNCWAPTPPTPPPPPPSPTPPAPPSPISSIIDIYLFDELLKHRNDSDCENHGFYTYYAFITAANFFPSFGTTGDLETRKREIAAFLAQTSHETTGGWPTAPDGPQAWGYCFVTERDKSNPLCTESVEWPCVPGKYYYGRGPIQLSHNYNYGPAGVALDHIDLLSNPDLLASDAVLSFRSALWFWMTPQSPKPSCHDAITGQWVPSSIDVAANRHPGFGVITNIINGGLECNTQEPVQVAKQVDRILFYEKYCDRFGVSYGEYIDCYNQKPFNWGGGLQDI